MNNDCINTYCEIMLRGREGNKLNDAKYVCDKNCLSQGQNLALTVLRVPNFLNFLNPKIGWGRGGAG